MVLKTITTIGIALYLVNAVSGFDSSTSSFSTSASKWSSTTVNTDHHQPSSDWAQHPYSDGRNGNPGAHGLLCKKSMDAVLEFASDTLAKAIQATTMDEFPINTSPSGTLTIKTPRVTEASFEKYAYSMESTNVIETRFYDGRMSANGVWQYKTNHGELSGGTYKAQIRELRLNGTNRLVRGNEARPYVKVDKCKVDMSKFRVEIRGADDIKLLIIGKALIIAKANDSQVIEDCDLDVCNKIRQHYEEEMCRLYEGFVAEVINKELQQFPTKMQIRGDQYRVDYGLLYNEPTVNESTKCIQFGMEGKYLWRSSFGSVPFNPPSMEFSTNDSMYTFHLSDYTFNTLFHQAHQNGHRFCAADKFSSSSSSTDSPYTTPMDHHHESLSLNCGQFSSTPVLSTSSIITTNNIKSSTSTLPPSLLRKAHPTTSTRTTRSTTIKTTSKHHKTTTRAKSNPRSMEFKCMGSLFANFSNFGPYNSDDMGDIVFKTDRAPAIVIRTKEQGFFDASNGVLEFYGAAKGHNGQRPLLARTDVRSMRGRFTPKLNKANITGSIKLDHLELSQASYLRMSSDWLNEASVFSKPLIERAINVFLDRFAQFPAPMPSKYECVSPTMRVNPHTIQMDCEVRRAQCETDTTCRCFRDSCVCSQPCDHENDKDVKGGFKGFKGHRNAKGRRNTKKIGH